MKKSLFFISIILFSFAMKAQISVKEGSFKEVEGFVNIDDKQYDDNGTPYAVIKVRTENIIDKERRDLSFDGGAGTSFELEYKDGEVWVYITYLASQLKITHPEFGSVSLEIPIEMKPKCGYEMLLVNKVEDVETGWGSIEVITKPEDGATISLNGKVLKAKTPYTNEMIAAGTYEIIVSKERYQPTTRTVVVKNGGSQKIEMEMVPVCGKLSVTANAQGAKVYIDGQEIGVTPVENKDVIIGSHSLTIVKDGYKDLTKTIELGAGQSLQLNESLEKIIVGALTGLFSINPEETAFFSQGNLQYQASTKTWRFADNQWDYIGEANKNVSPSYSGWIDLFTWGKGNDPNFIQLSTRDYKTFDDWGNNTISNGDNQANVWRTMTKDEWVYLLEARITESNERYAKAKVNGVCGLIILPDAWVSGTYKLQKINDGEASYNTNIISAFDWKTKLEANGAIFLPAAGSRGPDKKVYHAGENCEYWSSSRNENYAYFFYVYDSDIKHAWEYNEYNGMSVRLVCPYVVSKSDISISFSSIPTGANVYIDGKNYGVTPLVLNNLSVGSHNFKLAKEGWRPITKQFVVEKDSKLVFDETFEMGFGGVINAPFSVSPTDKVRFSQGNLQYDAATNKWYFADNQWDVIGKTETNRIATNYGRRDMFGWGTGSYPMNSTINNANYSTFNDWGNNTITNCADKSIKWRTLTRNEWIYLLEQRSTDSGMRYAMAVVNGVGGMILLPDSWDKKIYKLNKTNNPVVKSNKNTISKEDWEKVFEPNGAVFLPLAGFRGEWRRGKDVEVVVSNYEGYYWSSSNADGEYASGICFHSRGDDCLEYSRSSIKRYVGGSVRLVCPVK